MAWFVLLFAGTLEPVWANALATIGRRPRGRRSGPALLFLVASAASLGCLVYAMGELPTGTSYAVWVGLGSALTVAWSVIRGQEEASAVRLMCLGGIVVAVAGLKAAG
jgi:quaternary ammonium compound-resistance protein SugE